MPLNINDYILFEDSYILVINKPAGLMVEPDRNQNPNLLDQVKKYLKSIQTSNEDLYAQHIHRLDRPVSGVVLFAKQREVLRNLSEQFAERRVKKSYLALTENSPAQSEGVLEHWHRKEKKKAVLYKAEVQWSEKAKLSYIVTKLNENKYSWDIDLQTGKFHQIRAQLASVGCPIIGDFLYGSMVPYRESEIALHAYKLMFFHPITKNELVIVSNSDF